MSRPAEAPREGMRGGSNRRPGSFQSQVAAFVWARRSEHRKRTVVRTADVVEVFGCAPKDAARALWTLALQGRIACGAPGHYYAPRGVPAPALP